MSVQWSEWHIVRQMIWPVIKKYDRREERHRDWTPSHSQYTYSYRWIANNCNFKSSTAVIADIWWLLNIITSFSIERWWWRHRIYRTKALFEERERKSCMIFCSKINWISLTIFLMILNLEMHRYQLYEFDYLEDFYRK
jgi:hypothetical protein